MSTDLAEVLKQKLKDANNQFTSSILKDLYKDGGAAWTAGSFQTVEYDQQGAVLDVIVGKLNETIQTLNEETGSTVVVLTDSSF